MFYYRYRPATELAIKELIYDEMYFASEAECNDPYEGKMEEILENWLKNIVLFQYTMYDICIILPKVQNLDVPAV